MAATTQHSSFAYSPIDTSSIRLLIMHLGDDETIQLRFMVFPLSKCPAFVALSYMWGAPSLRHSIWLEGQEIQIRENLWSALHTIRKRLRDCMTLSHPRLGKLTSIGQWSNLVPSIGCPKCYRFFWIDALCINQDDMLERNHQVSMMKSIYTNADRVITWLGRGDEVSHAASWACSEAFRMWSSEVQPFKDHHRYEALIKSSMPLFKNKYWTRAWIVQEVMVAREIIVWYGNDSLLWEEVTHSGTALDQMELAKSVVQPCNNALHILQFKANFTKSNQAADFPLDLLMRYFMRQESEDVRDKIFSLIGLVGSNSANIEPDYTISREHLYERVLLCAASSPRLTNLKRFWNFHQFLRLMLKLPIIILSSKQLHHQILGHAIRFPECVPLGGLFWLGERLGRVLEIPYEQTRNLRGFPLGPIGCTSLSPV
jgi:hypothetical protein